MEYPHKKFLLFLLSRRLNEHEIAAECTRRGLLVPSSEDLYALRRLLEPFPAQVPKAYQVQDTAFRRWLRDRGLTHFWKGSAEYQEAERFLYDTHPRRDFETLVLAHGDLDRARTEMLLKHPPKIVPSLHTLEMFYECFWNIGAMSSAGRWEFLDAKVKKDERDELLPALEGDLETTYGMLGIRQRVQAEAFLDDLIALASQQISQARRRGKSLSGAELMGIAAISRQALDAVEQRKSYTPADKGQSLKERAWAFKLNKQKQPARIPSIDELEDNIIDVEPAETPDNVRQLPARKVGH